MWKVGRHTRCKTEREVVWDPNPLGSPRDKMRSGGKHLSSYGLNASKLRMWTRVSSLMLTFALASSVALGMPLHSSERGCNVPMEMPACEHMNPAAPGVVAVQLCCLLDCQEPGSTGSPQVQIPSLNLAAVPQVAPRSAFAIAKMLPQPGWKQGSFFRPPDTYLKNLALLI
jgi:hypothetical protein